MKRNGIGFSSAVAAFFAVVLLSSTTVTSAEKGNWNYELPQWVLDTGKTENPQFKWDVETGGWFFNFGPTGIRVKFDLDDPRVAKVMYIFEDSPAHENIFKGDEIIGVNGTKFRKDEPFPPSRGNGSFAISGPRLEVAQAIEEAEGNPKLNGVLSFMVRRDDKTLDVDIKLPQLGYFSETFPYDCKKSRLLAEAAAEWLVEQGDGRAKWGPRLGGHIDGIGQLALLSFGKKYKRLLQPDAKAYESDWAPLWTWITGIMGITFAETQQVLNDKKFLPRVERMALASAKKQGPAGQYSHKDYNPDGFKLAFATGLNGLNMALAKKCGAEIDEAAYLRTRYLLTFVTNEKGGIGYGAHNETPLTADDARKAIGNIKPSVVRSGEEASARLVGGAACTTLIHFVDPIDSFSEDFVKRGVRYAMSARWTSRQAHSGGSLTFVYNTITASIAPLVGEEKMYRECMDDMKWWLNMARCHDGSFYFEPKIDTEMIPGGRVLVTSAAILMLNAPLRELYVNGKGRTDPSVTMSAPAKPKPVAFAQSAKPVPVRTARTLRPERRKILDNALLSTLVKMSETDVLKPVPVSLSGTSSRAWLKHATTDGKLTFQVEGGEQTAELKWDTLKPIDHATLSLLVAHLKPESTDAQALAGVYMESLGKVVEADEYYEKAGEASAGKLQKLLD